MKDVRVAVLGAGGAAQVVHMPILARLAGVEVVGIVDPDVRKAETIGERFGVPEVAEDLSALLPGEPLDAVVVCTPNGAHEDGVLAALERGAHVLCERPLTVSSDSARRMIAAAESAERQLMVANNHRYRHDFRLMRQFVASGDLGEVFFVRSCWLNRRSRRPRRGWRTDAKYAGGGVLMDLGAQALDLALWSVGYPEVQRVACRMAGARGVESSAFMQLATASSTLQVEVTWELIDDHDQHELQILGSEGSASSYPLRVHRRLETGIGDVTPPLNRPPNALYQDSYRQEWAYFLRIVRGEAPRESESRQVELMRIVEACYRAADSGSEASLE